MATCFNCGRTGHRQSECRQGAPRQGQNTRTDQFRPRTLAKNFSCSKCGPGVHGAQDCPDEVCGRCSRHAPMHANRDCPRRRADRAPVRPEPIMQERAERQAQTQTQDIPAAPQAKQRALATTPQAPPSGARAPPTRPVARGANRMPQKEPNCTRCNRPGHDEITCTNCRGKNCFRRGHREDDPGGCATDLHTKMTDPSKDLMERVVKSCGYCEKTDCKRATCEELAAVMPLRAELFAQRARNNGGFLPQGDWRSEYDQDDHDRQVTHDREAIEAYKRIRTAAQGLIPSPASVQPQTTPATVIPPSTLTPAPVQPKSPSVIASPPSTPATDPHQHPAPLVKGIPPRAPTPDPLLQQTPLVLVIPSPTPAVNTPEPASKLSATIPAFTPQYIEPEVPKIIAEPPVINGATRQGSTDEIASPLAAEGHTEPLSEGEVKPVVKPDAKPVPSPPASKEVKIPSPELEATATVVAISEEPEISAPETPAPQAITTSTAISEQPETSVSEAPVPEATTFPLGRSSYHSDAPDRSDADDDDNYDEAGSEDNSEGEEVSENASEESGLDETAFEKNTNALDEYVNDPVEKKQDADGVAASPDKEPFVDDTVKVFGGASEPTPNMEESSIKADSSTLQNVGGSAFVIDDNAISSTVLPVLNEMDTLSASKKNVIVSAISDKMTKDQTSQENAHTESTESASPAKRSHRNHTSNHSGNGLWPIFMGIVAVIVVCFALSFLSMKYFLTGAMISVDSSYSSVNSALANMSWGMRDLKNTSIVSQEYTSYQLKSFEQNMTAFSSMLEEINRTLGREELTVFELLQANLDNSASLLTPVDVLSTAIEALMISGNQAEKHQRDVLDNISNDQLQLTANQWAARLFPKRARSAAKEVQALNASILSYNTAYMSAVNGLNDRIQRANQHRSQHPFHHRILHEGCVRGWRKACLDPPQIMLRDAVRIFFNDINKPTSLLFEAFTRADQTVQDLFEPLEMITLHLDTDAALKQGHSGHDVRMSVSIIAERQKHKVHDHKGDETDFGTIFEAYWTMAYGLSNVLSGLTPSVMGNFHSISQMQGLLQADKDGVRLAKTWNDSSYNHKVRRTIEVLSGVRSEYPPAYNNLQTMAAAYLTQNRKNDPVSRFATPVIQGPNDESGT